MKTKLWIYWAFKIFKRQSYQFRMRVSWCFYIRSLIDSFILSFFFLFLGIFLIELWYWLRSSVCIHIISIIFKNDGWFSWISIASLLLECWYLECRYYEWLKFRHIRVHLRKVFGGKIFFTVKFLRLDSLELHASFYVHEHVHALSLYLFSFLLFCWRICYSNIS